jgi:hypothetical protein
VARRSFGFLRRSSSGRWQASYTDPDAGRRVSARTTFATKADASVWLATVQADKARGDFLTHGPRTDPSRSGRRSGWRDCM